MQVPGMTTIQILRTILQQLGQPSAMSGNDSSYMRSAPASQGSENGADGAPKPTPATKAAFKAQYHAVLVEPSGHLDLAAAVSASGLQQVCPWDAGVLLHHVGLSSRDSMPCSGHADMQPLNSGWLEGSARPGISAHAGVHRASLQQPGQSEI